MFIEYILIRFDWWREKNKGKLMASRERFGKNNLTWPPHRRPAVASTAQSGIARRRRLYFLAGLWRWLSMPSPGTFAIRAAVGEIALYSVIIIIIIYIIRNTDELAAANGFSRANDDRDDFTIIVMIIYK